MIFRAFFSEGLLRYETPRPFLGLVEANPIEPIRASRYGRLASICALNDELVSNCSWNSEADLIWLLNFGILKNDYLNQNPIQIQSKSNPNKIRIQT